MSVDEEVAPFDEIITLLEKCEKIFKAARDSNCYHSDDIDNIQEALLKSWQVVTDAKSAVVTRYWSD